MEKYNITYKVSGNGSSDVETFGKTPGRNEGQSRENSWRSGISCRKDRQGKGPERSACSVSSRDRKEGGVAGAQGARIRVAREIV